MVEPHARFETLLNEAHRLQHAGDHTEAAGIYSRLLRDPSFAEPLVQHALLGRARSWMALGQDVRAWRDLARLPDSPEVSWMQARLRSRNQTREEALLPVLERARTHPHHLPLWQLVEALTPPNCRKIGHHGEVLLGMVAAGARDVDRLCRAAHMFLRARAPEETERVLSYAQAADPHEQRRIDLLRVRLYRDTRQHGPMQDILERLQPTNTEEAIWLAQCWRMAGQLEQAHALLMSARPSPMCSRWLSLTVANLCSLERLEAAEALVEAHGRPGDDAHVFLWAAKGDWSSVHGAAAHLPEAPTLGRLVLSAEAARRADQHTAAWTFLNQATSLVEACCPSLDLNMVASTHKVVARKRPTVRRRFQPMLPEAVQRALNMVATPKKVSARKLDTVRRTFQPMLPEAVQSAPEPEQDQWVLDHANDLLDRLGAERSELLIWTDPDGRRRIHHPEDELRALLGAMKGGLLDLGFAHTLARYDALEAAIGPHPYIHTYRSEIHLWSGDLDKAQADLEASLALDTTTRWAYVGLALLHVTRGAYEQALDILHIGTKRIGELTSGWPVAAEALLRLNRRTEGRVELARAIQHRPARLSIRVVEALYELADDRHPTALIGSIARTYPDLWNAATGTDDREKLNAMLQMMGANRSSSLIVWSHPTLGPCLEHARPLD